MSTGGSSSSIPAGGAGDSQPVVPAHKPANAEAAVAAQPGLVPSFGTPASTASVVTGPRTGGTVSAASKTWKPVYPFPQCLDNTLTYDVSFVGQRQYIQVGEFKVVPQLQCVAWIKLCRPCKCCAQFFFGV